MKKFLALLLALVMVFALAACGGTETTPTDTPDDSTVSEAPASEAPEDGGEEATFLPGGGSNIVYVITPATSNVFFATEAEVARAKAEELGYEVKTVSHDDDASRQLEAIEAAIADKAAFIILDNAGADATIEAVQAAYDAGIPCFLIDREINTTGIAVAQIVADNAQGAAAIAEKWVEAMNYEGKYAELLGLESDTNAQVRSDNFHSVIDQYPDLEMVAQQSANWDQTEAYEKTEAILEANPEITGIICGNDTMACGAAAPAPTPAAPTSRSSALTAPTMPPPSSSPARWSAPPCSSAPSSPRWPLSRPTTTSTTTAPPSTASARSSSSPASPSPLRTSTISPPSCTPRAEPQPEKPACRRPLRGGGVPKRKGTFRVLPAAPIPEARGICPFRRAPPN